MVFIKKDQDINVVIATCNCGCNSEFHIMKFIDDDSENAEYFMSLHSSKWDEEQSGIFTVIGRRLKRAWYNLIGRDYLYMDVVFSGSEFNEFISYLQEISKK